MAPLSPLATLMLVVEHGDTIALSLSIFLYKDLMLQCSKERSFEINLSTWLTKSVCVSIL